MVKGKILKYYREQKGYTQEQLSKGICSVSHLSKIERGITEYSEEITAILSKKLNINIQDEVNKFKIFEETLQEWQNAIVMLDTDEMQVKKSALDANPLKNIPDFQVRYSLLLARHYLVFYEIKKCHKLMENIKKLDINLSPYENNLYNHVQGIYYFSIGSYKKSIGILKKIDSNYSSQEYYYHLAISYHAVHNNTLAQYYAQKALHYFQETLNFTRILDTETLIILLINDQSQFSLKETRQFYYKLIQSAKKIQSVDRLMKLYYNFGQELFRRKHFKEGSGTMNFETVMQELEALGKDRMKKMYISNGAHEPLFGVATGAMKPIAKKIKINQPLAEELYSTGNYDAMYFAGIIADSKAMTESDFDRWMDGAYFYMLSDYVVAVTLSESDIAQDVADKWIASDDELRMSAGWSCYCWLLGNRKDNEFSESKISNMLDIVKNTIHESPERTKSSMNNFLSTVGISYLPLHEKAVKTAKEVGIVEVKREHKKSSLLNAYENIQKEIERGRLGFKRKYVRC